MNTKTIKVSYRKLPHWRVEDGTYFVTSRLADSLPLSVIREIAESRFKDLTPEEIALKRRILTENALDRSYGSSVLRRDDCAAIVQSALEKFDGIRYRLGPWTIMPNHMHNIVRPFRGNKLEEIVGAWKSVSAHGINARLRQTGELWQAESYDSWLRDENELRRVSAYILDNPVKAGLTGWKWVRDVDTTGLLIIRA